MKKQLQHLYEKIKKTIWPFWGTAVEGTPVYYEDTGDRMGTVVEVVRNAGGAPSGYRVRHGETGTVTMLPADALQSTKRGLLFTPVWHVEAVSLVRELEYAARHPRLHDLVDGASLTDDEPQDMATSDPELRRKIDHARQVRRSLARQLEELERKRQDVREQLMALSEQRLLRDISRRAFAEAVTEARRRARILDINIERCNDLLVRFSDLPFLPAEAPRQDDAEPEGVMPLRELMHSIPINVAVMDRSGVIRSVNEQFTENLHYEPGEVTGRPLSALMVGDGQHVAEMCDDGGASDMEFTIRDGRGKERCMYGRAMLVSDNGHGEVMALAFQEKMEESDTFRKMLTDQISHEFFNPLCIAQGYLYLLDEGKYGDLTPEQQRQVRSIAKNLKRIEQLVKETVQVKP